MADGERIIIVPLKIATGKAPKQQRANMSVKFIRKFIEQHTKATDVRISNNLNSALWEHSRERPPRKIKVKVSVEGYVANVMLPDEMVSAKAETKKDAKAEAKAEKPAEKKEEVKADKTEAKHEHSTPKAEHKATEASADKKTHAGHASDAKSEHKKA